MTDRRFIEEYFPVREVSEHSAKEKSIRHGHISTLHIWWARAAISIFPRHQLRGIDPSAKNNGVLGDIDKLYKLISSQNQRDHEC
jgi:hypothetical protein